MYREGSGCKHADCMEAQRARQGPINEAHAPRPPARPPPPGAAAAAPPAASPWVGAPRGASREPGGRLGAAGARVQEGGLALGVARGPLGCVTSVADCDLALCRSCNSWGKLQRRSGGRTGETAWAAWAAHGWRRRPSGGGQCIFFWVHSAHNKRRQTQVNGLSAICARCIDGRLKWNGATGMLATSRAVGLPVACQGSDIVPVHQCLRVS